MKKRVSALYSAETRFFTERTYSGMIASLGQTPAQVPQSMHLSASIT